MGIEKLNVDKLMGAALTAALCSMLAGCSDKADDPEASSSGTGSSSAAGSSGSASVASTSTTSTASRGSSSPTTTPGSESSSSGGEPVDPCAVSPETMADCVDESLYTQDLMFIAQPRTPGSGHHQAVQDLCFDRFTEYGFEVERQEFPTGVNVLGRKPGTVAADEIVVIAAHYDSVDEAGIEDCPGADDNATGTAGVLEAARVLAKANFDRTVVFACWDDEENHPDGAELGGSNAYVDRAVANGDNILVNYDLEMIGFVSDDPDSQSVPAGFDGIWPEQVAELMGNDNRGDFITIVADENVNDVGSSLVEHADRVGLRNLWLEMRIDYTTSTLFNDLRRSDHAPFWDAGISAIMITDTSEFRYNPYHCRDGVDEIGLLDHDFSTKVIQMTVGSASDYLGL